MTKSREEKGKRLSINKGVELMLRKTNKKREVPKDYEISFGKMFSLFSREFHFNFNFYMKKK
jgi:hypothetical protein